MATLEALVAEYHRVRCAIADNTEALNAGTHPERCSRAAHAVFEFNWGHSPAGGAGGARYPVEGKASGAKRQRIARIHPGYTKFLNDCPTGDRARAEQMVALLRACYEWTAEWLNPSFRTQRNGPADTDMPAAPDRRTRLEPMPTFAPDPPGGASSSTDNGDGTDAGGAGSPTGGASNRTRAARATRDAATRAAAAAERKAAAAASAAAAREAAREAARATRDAHARAQEESARREQERQARAEAERRQRDREARHEREAREAAAAQATAAAAAEAERRRAAEAQNRQGPATQPQFPEPAVPNLDGRRPENADEYGHAWEAIDYITVEECVVNPCSMLEDVPSQYTAAYAKVYVDILTYIEERYAAGDEAGVTRGLKWFLAVDAILLRSPHRQGQKGTALTNRRFSEWGEDGDMGSLIHHWRIDCHAAWGRRRDTEGEGVVPSELKRVKAALDLMQKGQLSACQKRLLSEGLHDPNDPDIHRQLLALHPGRQRPVPAAAPPSAARLSVSLRETFRTAQRLKASGPSGSRNEFLRALAMEHDDVRARLVIDMYEAFATRLVNGDLPLWFVVAWSSARLVALRKTPKPGCELHPPVPRPVTIGECALTAITTAVHRDYLPAFGAYLAPEQLAVGVKGGAGILVHGMRLRTQSNPMHTFIKLDCTAAFQTVSRAAILERMKDVPGIEGYAAFAHARLSTGRHVYAGRDMQRLFAGDGEGAGRLADADEGVGQGQADSPAFFCIAIHPEVKAFHAALCKDDGEASFYMDDGFADAPAAVVFPAAVQFVKDLASATGCVINGIECYSPAYDLQNCPHRAQAARELGIPIELAGVTSSDGAFHGGLNILGAPVGDHTFEQHRLQAKSDRVASSIDTTISLLRSVDTAALGALTYYTLQSRFDYWLQLASSPDIVQPMAAQIDAALLRAVSVPQCEISPLIADPLVLRRIRLPARRKGMGVRSRVDLANRAWLASFIAAAESFSDGGAVKHGLFVGLTDLFGKDAFARGGNRFAVFLQSDDMPYARALKKAWDGERSRLGLDNWDPAVALPKGPLSVSVDKAGVRAGVGPSLQHAICDQAEEYEAKQLDLALKALPPLRIRGATMPDPRLAAYMENDKLAACFALDFPHGHYQPSVTEYGEMFADFLGTHSPVAKRIGVGAPLQSARKNLRHPPTVDEHGFALSCLVVKGDHWRTQHDEINSVIATDTKRAGIVGSAEVGGLFADLLPARARGGVRRDGVRPDLRLLHDGRYSLYDLKTVRFIPAYYTQARVTRADRAAPIEHRAELVHEEYAKSIAALDRTFYPHIAEPAARPLTQRLHEYPRVVGLVFGQFGGGSTSVHALLKETANSAAFKHWRQAGATSPQAAVSGYVATYRRRWSGIARLASARLKLARAQWAGRGTPDPSAHQGASDFDPASHTDFGTATHPCVGGGTHRRRATSERV
jgi:hypothetical protein